MTTQTQPHPIVRAMADIIVKCLGDGRGVSDFDLQDFTRREIETHLPAAERLARQRFTKRIHRAPRAA